MMTSATTGASVEEVVEQLLRDVERYLEAVELFREEGLEPRWAHDELVPATDDSGEAPQRLISTRRPR
jgi:hypothetical protein